MSGGVYGNPAAVEPRGSEAGHKTAGRRPAADRLTGNGQGNNPPSFPYASVGTTTGQVDLGDKVLPSERTPILVGGDRTYSVSALLRSMTNSMGNWARETLPAFEELYAATEQMSLEAGAAGDSVKETGSLEEAARSVDIARERVARAAAAVRRCPQPPDFATARQLAATLDALDEFGAAERFDDWVQAWCRAMEYRDAFIRAFAIANGQTR